VPDQNDDERKGLIALFPWLVTAATVAVLAIALLTGGGDSTAASSTPADLGATTTEETIVAPEGDGTTTAPAATGDAVTGPVPEEVASDPVVQRLARGRTLPFTAGPWRREQWRDAVYARLRPATQERAEKVAQGGGFGILIQ
jgi:hypothetical protein